jgi:3-hydroxyisobutyrate dehydrogenase-like beta-hydroxyacid dehydrogenase
MAARVGFIGLGIMGSRMAANLRNAGFEVTVWNRTATKAAEWASMHGAEVASTPAALASESDFVITMVVDGPQVESVLLGPDGAASSARAGLLCIDMSTIGPTAARRIAGSLSDQSVRFMDAPVSGSSPAAERGTLTIMAGAEESDFARARAVLEAMGELIVHVGPVGHGQMVKLINNGVAAVNTVVVGEALLLGKRAGIDLDALVEVMSAGSGGSAMLDLKAPAMRRHDYTTLFRLEHMLKDVSLCLEEAARGNAVRVGLSRERAASGSRRPRTGRAGLRRGDRGTRRANRRRAVSGHDAGVSQR